MTPRRSWRSWNEGRQVQSTTYYVYKGISDSDQRSTMSGHDVYFVLRLEWSEKSKVMIVSLLTEDGQICCAYIFCGDGGTNPSPEFTFEYTFRQVLQDLT